MLHTLFQTSLKYTSVFRYDEWFVTRLLVDDGRVHGVVAIDMKSGRVDTITAHATILCTGGCGRVFPFTTNASIKNGDGMALAYRAGAPLKDMEFIQYHPTGLPFTGILITEAARSEGGYLVNKDGYRYLQDYDLGTPSPTPVLRSRGSGRAIGCRRHSCTKSRRGAPSTRPRALADAGLRSMELGPRDRLSQAFVHEVEKGRTIDTPYGPVVHYMMGGVHTDINGATPLAGLYAAGEVACVSINGANRLGSNSLPELLVFGARAGTVAAEYASSRTDGPSSAVFAQAKDEERQLQAAFRGGSGRGEKMAPIRDEMQKAMEDGVGIYRTGASLTQAATTLRTLQDRFRHVAIDDHSQTFNTERISAVELGFMLDVAEAIANAAVTREESRGAHQRTDFPGRDDGKYLAHSLVSRNADGSSTVGYLPVTITRWPPGERVYGR